MLGKVFWVGALAEIGGRDQGELELALHELARKELVRPARVSSMEGESEYSFWHLLVRDVAYGQIPQGGAGAPAPRRGRLDRAQGRRAGRGPGRGARPPLPAGARARRGRRRHGAGRGARRACSPLPRARRRAGARPRYRPGRGAARPRARALPGRRSGAAGAARPLGGRRLPGRPPARGCGGARRGARLAPCPRRDGGRRTGADPAPLARRLPPRRGPAVSRSPPRRSRCSSRSRPARRSSLPTRSSRARTSSPAPTREAIAAADRARALAETLGLPEPARALGYRGYARAYLGDADGLAEMERALALLVEQGAGRRRRHPAEQPRASPATRSRGPPARSPTSSRGSPSASSAASPSRRRCSRPTAPACSAELGRPEEALERAGRLAAVARGERRHVLADRGARGRAREPPRPRRARSARRGRRLARSRRHGRIGAADVRSWSHSRPPPPALAADAPEQACALLAELEQTAGRTRVALLRQTARPRCCEPRSPPATPTLAKRLADGLEPRYPLDEHALCAARAQLAEHAGDHADAATLYAEAAARWQEFGNVPERAYALLGQGRCLLALGRPGSRAAAPRGARAVRSMGYRPALAETEALLEQTAAAPAS